MDDGNLEGYSAALNLNLRWEGGELVFYDPATGRRIVTLEDERVRADNERARADSEHAARVAAEARAAEAEARIRELEARVYNTDL